MVKQTLTEEARVFISHAWEDKTLALRLESELQAANVAVWVDHSDIRGGDNLPMRISDALEWCNVLLLLWSNAACNSDWVKLEWTNAISLKKNVIPCLLDETALPAILANRVYLDFCIIENGIMKLLEALNLVEKSSKNEKKRSIGIEESTLRHQELLPQSERQKKRTILPSNKTKDSSYQPYIEKYADKISYVALRVGEKIYYQYASKYYVKTITNMRVISEDFTQSKKNNGKPKIYKDEIISIKQIHIPRRRFSQKPNGDIFLVGLNEIYHFSSKANDHRFCEIISLLFDCPIQRSGPRKINYSEFLGKLFIFTLVAVLMAALSAGIEYWRRGTFKETFLMLTIFYSVMYNVSTIWVEGFSGEYYRGYDEDIQKILRRRSEFETSKNDKVK